LWELVKPGACGKQPLWSHHVQTKMSVASSDRDCYNQIILKKGGPPTMETVVENRGQGMDIFCAIDLHD